MFIVNGVSGASLHCINFGMATDPACGSGNFLTETYICLRRMENDVLKLLYDGQVAFGFSNSNPIKVSISQFYGIEINDFAVTVAKTALWIAESQMLKATEDIIHMNLDFLPLSTNAYIVEGNAIRVEWEDIVPKNKLNYIMGNPPFIGNAHLSEEQKEDRNALFQDKGGELDYVCCWYKKAAQYISNKKIECAFVSTNSICQGQQAPTLWKPLIEMGITINFAYKTFIWDSEAPLKAQVHCIIIGFSQIKRETKLLFDGDLSKIVNNINGYLIDAPNIFVEKRRKPLYDVPSAIKGFQPTDDGNLLLSNEEKDKLLLQEPNAEKWIKEFITAKEYISGVKRWCLWLVGISPSELNQLPLIKERVKSCYEWRKQQKVSGDAYKLKDTPTLMRPSSKFKEGNFIILPLHSAEKRRYIPFGFVKDCIPGNSVSIIPEANLYHFGILTSNIHMAWTRAICGRIKSDYRYSIDIVYNNFPWPNPTDEQRLRIEQTAQAILDARSLYSDSSLADLYDEIAMPNELIKAHQQNDKAVMAAYGFKPSDEEYKSESACIAALMKLYQSKISEQ